MNDQTRPQGATALTVDSRDAKGRYADIPMVRDSVGWQMMPSNFGELVSFAGMMAQSGEMVRKQFRGNPGACLGIVMKANRWGFDPWDVANKSYFVNDQMCFEGQLVHAIIMTSGLLTDDDVDFDFLGSGPDRQVKVTATIRKNGKVREYMSPPLKDINPKNSPLWKSDPDQQLCYFGITKWARRWLPTAVMGVALREEIEAIDVTPTREQNAERLEKQLAGSEAAKQNFVEASVAQQAGAMQAGEPVAANDAAKPDYEAQLAAFTAHVAALQTGDEINAFVSKFGTRPGEEWWGDAPDEVRRRCNEIAEARWNEIKIGADKPPADDDAGDGPADHSPGDAGPAGEEAAASEASVDDAPTNEGADDAAADVTELLQMLEDGLARATDDSAVDALISAVSAPGEWLADADGGVKATVSAMIERHRARIAAAKAEAAPASRKKAAPKSDSAEGIDPQLLETARKAAAEGMRKFKLWRGGKIDQAQFDANAPVMKELEAIAKKADEL